MSGNQVSKASRRTVALSMRDGLFDILLGSFFVVLSLQEPLEQRGLSVWLSYMPALAVMVIGLVVYYRVKRKVVTPRIGLVKASIRTNPQRRWLLGIAVGLQLVTLLIFVLGYTGWLGENMPENTGILVDAFFGVAIFGFFAFMAYTLQSPRFYLYGFVLGLTPPLGVLLRSGDAAVNTIPQMVAGLVMVVGGIVTYVSFLKAYPEVEQEAMNG